MNLQVKHQQQCVAKSITTRCFVQKAAKHQQGLTLVELLIAIALGLFLTWGAMQAFLTGKQTYTVQQSLSRIQETGRMAKEFLTYDIRTAGQLGGTSALIGGDMSADGCGQGVIMLNNRTKVNYAFGQAVFGANNVPANATGGMNMVGALNPVPIANTDILVVHNAVTVGQTLTPPGTDWRLFNYVDITNTGACAVGASSMSTVCVNDIIGVGDMTQLKIFQATAVTTAGNTTTITHAGGAGPGNACSLWGGVGTGATPHAVAAGAEVLKMNTVIYYVGRNATTNRPSLYRYTLSGVSEELLEGVEDMQLEFVVATANNGFPNAVSNYKTANAITAGEWDLFDGDDPFVASAVRSVRYSLLIRGEDDFTLAAPQRYTYPPTINGVANAVVTTAPDRRMRQIFSGTVAIRNRSK